MKILATLLACAFVSAAGIAAPPAFAAEAAAPEFKVDPFWPKPLPNNWIVGQIGGITVDAQDHVWVFQRPRSLNEADRGATLTPKRAICCVPAPSVVEFDPSGAVVQGWGGPGTVPDWPEGEHAIYVDGKNQVWLTGNGDKDAMLLKFTRDGKFLKQFGRLATITNSLDTSQLGRAAGLAIDPAANEIFIADGYSNHRIIVLDADTLGFKRMWGAYGKPPTDLKLPIYNPAAPQFANPVHCVRIAHDGLVYVCDRSNDRVQVFHKDGSFVKEFAFLPETRGTGSSYDLEFWPDKNQTYFILADGANGQAHVVRRDDGKIMNSFGHYGRMAGQFHNIHTIALDSKGNVYTGEVDTGMRVQKFTPNIAPEK
jgi:DNA-binding beta-propeller fold protein YncE